MLVSALPYCLLILLAFAAFYRGLGGYFVSDDLLQISYLWKAFNVDPVLLISPFYGPWLKDQSLFCFYRPLAELSLALDYFVYGSRAVGFHLTSLLWHCANACLVFILINTLTEVPGFYIAGKKERNLISFFCAAIWAVYPTHCEAVSWISARSDLIATFFYLTAMICFAKHVSGKSNFPAALVALPMVLCCLTKELTVSQPFALFCLYFFSAKNFGPQAWLKSLRAAAAKTAPYFAIIVVYLIVRGLALGSFVGGYVGSVGFTLNQSFANRWIYGPSFFKIFHPFNDHLIAPTDGLREVLRIIWGMCGVMCLIWARVGGAIAGKYRLMLFAFAWLFFTLAPNAQVWSFSETMAGGRIAYLPTIPIVLLVVLAVYPMGASSLPSGSALFLRIMAFATMGGLIVLGVTVSSINENAWLLASNAVRQLRGQVNALVDQLADGQRLAVINLPNNITGAYAFTSPGMLEALLKQPLHAGDASNRAVVLDDECCSYPAINLSDVKAAISSKNKDQFIFYYYDPARERLARPEEGKLVKIDADSSSESGVHGQGNSLGSPECKNDLHNYEEGGEDFRFHLSRPINPCQFEYAKVTVRLGPQAKIKPIGELNGVNSLEYIWSNCPPDAIDETESFSQKLVHLPAPGQTATYLINLGANKRWLLSHDVDYFQWFITGLKDAQSSIKLELLAGADVYPLCHAAVEGESKGESLLSLKHLSKKQNQTLQIHFDGRNIAGAKEVKIELLPAHHYFEHYARLLPARGFLPQHLKVFNTGQVAGILTLTAGDFPTEGVYQFRACSVDGTGEIVGDFCTPITVTVAD